MTTDSTTNSSKDIVPSGLSIEHDQGSARSVGKHSTLALVESVTFFDIKPNKLDRRTNTMGNWISNARA